MAENTPKDTLWEIHHAWRGRIQRVSGGSEMVEWLMIAAMAGSGAMFAIGGTGPKFVRRFILPVYLGVIALLSHIIWWKCLGLALPLVAALSLGYGEKKPYWYKGLVFISYVLPTLFLGFTWWQIITPPLCLLMFRLSNWKPTSHIFRWKICEFAMGALIGITVASLLK